MSVKLRSVAILLVGIASATPAKAEELRADEARRLIAGRHFAYTCFEGTSGHGRIYADGSAAGYIKVGGGPLRYVVLPAGTLRVRGEQYCASLRGIPFEPCFNLDRTNNGFRGSVSGFRFAYCDFHRGSARAEMASRSSRSLGLRASAAAE
jgi:hypothetical protein